MSMQAGIGLSKILVLAGAGYTGTILVKNGKLSEIIGELQALVKRIEKSGEHSDGDSDASDAMHRLAMEVRQLASARQITVLNATPGADFTPFIIPAATLGVVGYGYMWFKGISFSDIMCITKRNMENAVSNLTKHLESISETLSSAKKHLAQRLKKVDDKVDLQKKLSKEIQENVNLALEDLIKIGGDFEAMHDILEGVDGKLDTLEYKQDIANMGLMYLCNSMGRKNVRMPEFLMEGKLQVSGNSKTRLLTNAETSSPKGLIEIYQPGTATEPRCTVTDLSGSYDFVGKLESSASRPSHSPDRRLFS
ncbi:PREDICTED: uncharacterized protein LOC104805136 [Tarenaya hassleriana]|uniref:uncharacterized protein LOC104805136 n=1 Tax=Tarenaya hassleriana TaxID=28532 RepID=UPI00053C7F9F|nr:PREDICTED: uncharacterized protein LOC104805136 [Tarenaya hassleriana]